MISLSKKHNPNYICKVVEIIDSQWRKHSNADRLKCVTIDFNNVITGLDMPAGVYVYFPVGSCINLEFLSRTNSFSDSSMNQDKEVRGFFGKNGRVKAIRLRGERSSGYIVPAEVLDKMYGSTLKNNVGKEFDTISGTLLVKKYIIPNTANTLTRQKGKIVRGFNRVIEDQIRLHGDTENFRRNVDKIGLEDKITISYKMHGTSMWLSHVRVKKFLNWYQKLGKVFGFDIKEEEYDYIYGSRRTVKNKYINDPKGKDHFYSYDLWGEAVEGIKIPRGYSIYGEIVGYTKEGGYIQKPFDYGCMVGEHKVYVYKVTFTTPDGLLMTLSTEDAVEFCDKNGLLHVPVLFDGTVSEWLESNYTKDLEDFIPLLEEKYNEKDCYICANKVPEEGIVIRKENSKEFEAYKLKSFRFLEMEDSQMDEQEKEKKFYGYKAKAKGQK